MVYSNPFHHISWRSWWAAALRVVPIWFHLNQVLLWTLRSINQQVLMIDCCNSSSASEDTYTVYQPTVWCNNLESAVVWLCTHYFNSIKFNWHLPLLWIVPPITVALITAKPLVTDASTDTLCCTNTYPMHRLGVVKNPTMHSNLVYHMVYLFWVRYSWWIILWGQRPKTKKEVKLQLWLSCEKAQGGEVRGIFTESSVCDVTFPFLKIVFACLHTDSSLTTETSKTGTSLHFFTPSTSRSRGVPNLEHRLNLLLFPHHGHNIRNQFSVHLVHPL